MPGKPTKRPKPATNASPRPGKPGARISPKSTKPAARSSSLPTKPAATPPDARYAHGCQVPAAIYRSAIERLLGHQLESVPDAGQYVKAVIADMAPRDPVEEMAITQLLLAHVRAMHLTSMTNQPLDLHTMRTIHEYADRASNTFRRLMLALAEYRRPPRTGDTFAVVKQANIAHQQVIQNHENSNTNPTNEQGCVRAVGTPTPEHTAAAALPAHPGGAEGSACVRPAREAVDEVHRTANARGQVPLAPERDKAR